MRACETSALTSQGPRRRLLGRPAQLPLQADRNLKQQRGSGGRAADEAEAGRDTCSSSRPARERLSVSVVSGVGVGLEADEAPDGFGDHLLEGWPGKVGTVDPQ